MRTLQADCIDFVGDFISPVSPKSIRSLTDEQMHKRGLKCSPLVMKGGVGRNKDELHKWPQTEGENKEPSTKLRRRQVLKGGDAERDEKMN